MSIYLFRVLPLLFGFMVFTSVDEGRAQETLLLDPSEDSFDNRNFHLQALQVLVPLISCGFLVLGIFYCFKVLICKPFYLEEFPLRLDGCGLLEKTFPDSNLVESGNQTNEEIRERFFDTRMLTEKETSEDELLDIRIT